jgi:hypothetical protein
MSDGKVIGYLASVTDLDLICEGDSCIIAGTHEKMRSYIMQRNPHLINKVTIRKARFGNIRKAMQLGAAYSFDEESYKRFYPLARKKGINVGPEDFTGETPTGLHFMRVQKMSVSRN